MGTCFCQNDPGGTDLERGYGDVRPWRPPFHASPAVRKGLISSKSISSQGPLLRKFGNFSLYSLNFCRNFSSQAPKFGNFQLTSPQIRKFLVHKPPNLEIFSSQAPLSEASISSQTPHFGNPGRTPLPEKSWVPPGKKTHKKIVVLRLEQFTPPIQTKSEYSQGFVHKFTYFLFDKYIFLTIKIDCSQKITDQIFDMNKNRHSTQWKNTFRSIFNNSFSLWEKSHITFTYFWQFCVILDCLFHFYSEHFLLK